MDFNQTNQLSFGEKLKTARNNLNLTINQVSKELMIKEIYLQGFENNQFIFDALPVTFAKGYLKKYLQFLDLSATLIESIDFGASELDLTAISSPKKHKNHSDLWINLGTVAVILFIISMVYFGWQQLAKQNDLERENLIAKSNVTSDQKVDNNVTDTTQGLEIKEEPNLNTEENTKEKEITAKKSEDITKVAVENQSDTKPVIEPTEQIQPNFDALQFNFSGNSWLTVKKVDSGEIVLSKLYKAGQSATVKEDLKYKVIIGDARNVKVLQKGKPLELNISKNFVADFTTE